MRTRTLLALAGLLTVAGAKADLLVVSGDSNIGNALNGTIGAPAGNNATFFTNLLASGTKVVFQETTNGDTATEGTSQAGIEGFYSGLSGVSVTTLTGGSTVTASQLAGANLFIGFLPDIPYNATTIAALSGFLNSGGNVLLTGEWGGFDSVADNNLNAALAALGSTMQLDAGSYDIGLHTATGGQIHTDPLTAGVGSFVYAAASGVSGGTALFDTTANGPFMEYQRIGTVPEPSTLLISIMGLGLVAVLRRRGLRARQ